MSTLFVDVINEKTSGNGVLIPGHSAQVLQQVYSTFTTFTSNSYTDTGITLSITPKSTSSKILIIASIQCSNGSGANANETGFQFVRGSTSIRVYERPIFVWNQGNDNTAVDANISLIFLDSPSTTSATTYKVQAKTSAGTMRVNDYATANGNGCSTLTLMEIAQ
tara:strand:+ start:592 stop:1086 length:495 start_codon:yes stop_codon:yes gene_type:complete